MKTRPALSSVAVVLLLVLTGVASGKEEKEKAPPPKVAIPQPGVPQIMTMEGRFVRAAYNNEGYAILGYRVANLSVGEKWMVLDFGVTVRDGVPEYTMTRDTLSLSTPDGKTIALATNEEFRTAPLQALEMRAQMQRDSINYFPPHATNACRIGFFADLDSGARPYDQVALTSQRACAGRVYFQVPDGIARGQHWLNVKFAKSEVRVPFRILTEEEYKLLDKNYKDIEKQVEEAFKPKG